MSERLKWLQAWCLATMLAAWLPMSAQAQVALDWSSATPQTYGDMIALDAANNAYVAGSDPLALTMVVSKYSPTGQLLWRRVFDNPGTTEQSAWIAVDAAGNAIVVGSIVRASDLSTHGRIVLKYDPNGNLLWQEVAPSAYAHALRVVTDVANNIYVLGRAWLTNASGNTTLDIVTIKYAPNGMPQWTRALGFDNFSSDSPSSIALTPAGNAIVVGGRVAAAYDPAGNVLWTKTFETSSAALDVGVGRTGEFYIVGGTYSAATGNVFLVHRFDASFNLLWRRTYAVGPWAWRVVVDSRGNAVLAGVSGVYMDWMTIKVDPDGNLLWSRRYDEHRANDEVPYFMAVGPDDAVYITGQGGPGPATGNLSYLRTVTVKYAPDGTSLWAATTFDSVRGIGLKLASDGSVFVLGESPLTVFHYRQTGSANVLPIVKAAASVTSGAAPLAVTFSSAGTTDPDGSILRYDWAFGDGGRSADPAPVHTYAAGQWTATLTVTDNMGASVTSAPILISVTAAAPPPPPASATVPTGIVFGSASIVGGRRVTATVTLSSTAGAVVTLASSDPGVASVPATVQVPAGSSRASFTVQTSRVRADTSVTIRASANGSSTSATLAVLQR